MIFLTCALHKPNCPMVRNEFLLPIGLRLRHPKVEFYVILRFKYCMIKQEDMYLLTFCLKAAIQIAWIQKKEVLSKYVRTVYTESNMSNMWRCNSVYGSMKISALMLVCRKSYFGILLKYNYWNNHLQNSAYYHRISFMKFCTQSKFVSGTYSNFSVHTVL